MAAPLVVPLGTYSGTGTDPNGDEITYCLRLLERKLMSLDYKQVLTKKGNAINGWHSEGIFTIVTSGDKTVVKAEIGGMPGQVRQGDIYEFDTNAPQGELLSAPVLSRDGVFLQPGMDTMSAQDAKFCAECEKKIEGQLMKYGDKMYHKDCFVCSKCKSALVGSFKNNEDGTRLCTDCIPVAFCETCSKAIQGKVTSAGGKSYHPECFICASCSEALTGGFFTKNGQILCKPCLDSSSTGKTVIRRVCRGCKKPIEADQTTVDGEKNEVFHPECFVCADCSCTLESAAEGAEAKFKVSNGKYQCVPCGEKNKAPEAPPCIICKSPAGADYVRLMDGSHLHWNCFKCSGCGTAETASGDAAASMKQLRNKVKLLQEGKYQCDACASGKPPAPKAEAVAAPKMPFGCYLGKGPGKEGEELTYVVRLIEEASACWLDCTTKTKIASGSWHAEGRFTEETSGGEVTCVKFTVDSCPFGGGPAKGKVYEFAVQEKDLMVEGFRCQLQAGVPDIDSQEVMKAPAPAQAEAAKPVPKAVPKEASQALPGEGAATKMTQGGHGVMERKEVDTMSHNVVKTEAKAAPAPAPKVAPAAPAPAAKVEAPPAAAKPAPAGFFTLDELKDSSVWKEKGIEAGDREIYLADDAFMALFGVNKADFAKLPKWKRDGQKKQHGLF